MAIISTAANGNWSNTATWTGAALPGVGDTAKVDHAVTLDGNYSVGAIDDTSAGAILASAAGSYRLIVGNPKPAFIVRGLQVTG